MSTYAILVADESGQAKQATLVDDMDQALGVAAMLAQGGAKPRVFQEIPGEVVLTAKIVPPDEAGGIDTGTIKPAPTNGHTNGNGHSAAPAHPPRRPVLLREPGAKRPSGEIAKLRARALSYILTNPGNGVEEMAKSLNVSTRDLVLPLRQLVDEKKIAKSGQARAVKYAERTKGTPAKPAKKAAKRAA